VPAPVAGAASLLAALQPGGAPGVTAGEIASRTVAVVGSGGAGVEAARLLRAAGAEVSRAETVVGGYDLVVCAAAPPELPLLAEWNDVALEIGAPWLQVLPFDGRYAAVGPLYLPGETCCRECFRRRRSAGSDASEELALLDSEPATYPTAPAVDALVGGLAAHLALSWLVLADHHSPAAFYAIELQPAVTVTMHHVHRVPRCPRCSGLVDVAPPLPWYKEMPGVRG
jgi:bacteriocin biosynthesis cyclodehydratase domain-containing protein